MSETPAPERTMPQKLQWGPYARERLSPASTMWGTAGRRIYALGDIDGCFRPRSNPYDLYAFGKPHPEDPLAGRLQGVWAQPVRGAAGYGYTLTVRGGEDGAAEWPLEDAGSFTQSYASVSFTYRLGALDALRRDYASADLPVLFSTLTLTNLGAESLDVGLSFRVTFDLCDAWFISLANERNSGETVAVEQGALVARAAAAPDRWASAAAMRSEIGSSTARLTGDSQGEITCDVHLPPGARIERSFAIAVVSEGGAAAALAFLRQGLSAAATEFAAQEARFAAHLERGPRLNVPDPRWNAAFALARANLQMLEAQQPVMGEYFYAGLEMFPFWFSNDGAYSVPGLMIGGLSQPARNHVRIGARYLENGRVPHQISPSGRVAFAGNAPETPLWIISIWDAYRWSGDRGFLADLYPAAWDGMFRYVLGTIDPDGDGYPSGPGMVEVEGMGEEKLDSAAYTWSALHALAHMAEVLEKPGDASTARARAGAIAARFESDWWDAGSGTFAMSLKEPGNMRYPVPHWAVIVPLEVGLASPSTAAQTIDTLRRDYLNAWGLKHTVGDDERVWTLPTATLSRAAYRCADAALGLAMLGHIMETLETGSIGLFHELIPEGACIIQLWSAAAFLRGVVEDLLGVEVQAAEHLLSIAPRLPADWDEVILEDLCFGSHRVSMRFSAGGVIVTHHEGGAPLTCLINGRSVLLAPGSKSG